MSNNFFCSLWFHPPVMGDEIKSRILASCLLVQFTVAEALIRLVVREHKRRMHLEVSCTGTANSWVAPNQLKGSRGLLDLEKHGIRTLINMQDISLSDEVSKNWNRQFLEMWTLLDKVNAHWTTSVFTLYRYCIEAPNPTQWSYIFEKPTLYM